MESFLDESLFNIPTQTSSLDILDKNEFSSIFDAQKINESWINIPFDGEDNMRIYYIIKKDDNNLFQLNKNNIKKELDFNRKFISIKIKGQEDKDNIFNNEHKINSETEIKKRGRRKVGKIYKEKAKHTKSSDDNKMRKIKTSLLEYILKKLNKSIKSNIGRFRPLNKTMKESLKKKENMELLDAKIKDIFSKTKMNKVSEKNGESNKKLIEKIYEDNKEKETIDILEMEFKTVLNQIKQDSKNFLDLIKDKEIRIQNKKKCKENFNVEKYMDEVKKLLEGYEDWFGNKKGRNE